MAKEMKKMKTNVEKIIKLTNKIKQTKQKKFRGDKFFGKIRSIFLWNHFNLWQNDIQIRSLYEILWLLIHSYIKLINIFFIS